MSDGTDETAEFKEEDGAEQDVFGFDDGEELTDEENEAALGDYLLVRNHKWMGEHTEITKMSVWIRLVKGVYIPSDNPWNLCERVEIRYKNRDSSRDN